MSPILIFSVMFMLFSLMSFALSCRRVSPGNGLWWVCNLILAAAFVVGRWLS